MMMMMMIMMMMLEPVSFPMKFQKKGRLKKGWTFGFPMTFEKTSLFEPHGVKHAFKMIKSIDIETCFFRFSRENGEAHGETRMTFPQIQSLLEYLGGGKEVPMPEALWSTLAGQCQWWRPHRAPSLWDGEGPGYDEICNFTAIYPICPVISCMILDLIPSHLICECRMGWNWNML